MKKYRIFAVMGVIALTAGSLFAQDYDDIYYDASKSKTVEIKTKKSTPAKTVVVYGDVPEKYKVAVQDNYRELRDEDEYNRRGAYDPSLSLLDYEVDINGDTIYFNSDSIYDEAFANTRRIERFYNPDIVILSDDEDLVQLYYDESPTINLIVGSDWSYGWDYGFGYYPWYTSYYPWYTGYYYPWHFGYYRPWYSWYSSWYPDWYYPWWRGGWYNGWYGEWFGFHGWHHHHWHNGYWDGGNYSYSRPSRPYGYSSHFGTNQGGQRVGLATNRNGRSRVDNGVSTNRNSIASRTGSNRSSGASSRGGYATSRNSGNMGSRGNAGVTTRSSSTYSGSRSSSSYGGSRSSSSYGGSRSSGSSYGGSRSSGSSSSYSGPSRSSSSSGGGYSSGSSGGSHGSSGGHSGGSSGGGGRRR